MSAATIAPFNARSEAIVRLGSWASPAPSAPPVMRPIACSMIRPIRSPFIRPQPVRLQERTCWQALYQASPPPSSAQEKRARGRSRCGSAGLERFWSGFEQTAEALRYALLDAHRFHRHGLRIEAELFEHRCVGKPAASTVTYTASGAILQPKRGFDY